MVEGKHCSVRDVSTIRESVLVLEGLLICFSNQTAVYKYCMGITEMTGSIDVDTYYVSTSMLSVISY